MLTLYLVLAHFIADFILQPERLIRWKHQELKGHAVHALIHILVSYVMVLPFLPDIRVFLGVLGIGITHFVIDAYKLEYEKKSKNHVFSFITDQIAHIAIIFSAVVLIGNVTLQPWFQASSGAAYQVYTTIAVPVGLILGILVTYGYELTLYQSKKDKEPVFKPNYCRMCKNLMLWGVIYALFLIFGVYTIAAKV